MGRTAPVLPEPIFHPANVSQEATGDAAQFAIDGEGCGTGKSRQMGVPRRLSSRLLAGLATFGQGLSEGQF